MKRIITFLLALCVLAPVTVMADAAKDLEKARKKERKEVMNRYKKEGWKLFGSTRSLEVALLSHWDKLDKEGTDAREIMGVSTRTKSKNIGAQSAINNACITYAQQAGSSLQGQVVSDINVGSADEAAEFDHFYAAYQRQVEKEIQGEMEQSISLIREYPDGTCEVQTYFVVSENAATKARMRALENALKESEAAQKYAERVKDFVKSGFDK